MNTKQLEDYSAALQKRVDACENPTELADMLKEAKGVLDTEVERMTTQLGVLHDLNAGHGIGKLDLQVATGIVQKIREGSARMDVEMQVVEPLAEAKERIEKKHVSIIISGKWGTPGRPIALLLRRWLELTGVKVTVRDDQGHLVPSDVDKTERGLDLLERIAKVTEVTINVEQLPREDKTEEDKPSPIQDLVKALSSDRGYLMGWHANLACATFDSMPETICHDVRWKTAQQAARAFLSNLMGCPTLDLIQNNEVRNGVKDTPHE